jgi:transcriptional regulator with XRE-family HTH domain
MGLSQRQLAEELGVHVMTVSRWERGARAIPEPVARLVERLNREKRQEGRTGTR